MRKYYPVSYAQQRIWFLQNLEPESTFYNIEFISNIKGVLDEDIFKNSLEYLLKRHESLRTTFKSVKGEPFQFIHDFKKSTIDNIFYFFEAGHKVEKEIKFFFKKPYNLEKGPLLKIALVRKNEKYKLYFFIHHIIFDGWSLNILSKELSLIYNSLIKKEKPDLDPVSFQYKDFAVWERLKISQKNWKRKKNFWVKKMAGNLPVFTLPEDKQRKPQLYYVGGREKKMLEIYVADKINHFCKKNQVTHFTFLFSALSILLSRLNNQKDSIIGVPSANRQHQEFRNTIGFFVNMLPIRSYIFPEKPFIDYLADNQKLIQNSIINEQYPLEKIINAINPERNLSHPSFINIVFQAIPDYYNFQLKNKDFKIVSSDVKNNITKFDLKIIVIHNNQGFFTIKADYNNELYNKNTIKEFLNCYQIIINNILKNPKSKIKKLDILSLNEKNILLNKFNNTKKLYPKNNNINQLFEKQVKKTPNNIAVEFDNKQLTYNELNERVKQLSWLLKENKINQGAVVALVSDGSLEIIVGILAVLKNGATYVPLDYDFPADRIKTILKDCNARVILTQKKLVSKIKTTKLKTIILDDNKNYQRSSKNLKNKFDTKKPACIIYTSGSAGTHKGVVLSHQGLINQAYARITEYKINEKDTLAQNRPFGSVASIWLYLTALFTGARVVFYPKAIIQDFIKLINELNEDNVTILTIPTTILYALNSDDLIKSIKGKISKSKLRVITFGGESFSPRATEVFNQIKSKNIKYYNTYGQSECSDTTLQYLISGNVSIEKTPIGSPLINTQVYVLDKNKNILPINTVGEIYISGDGLARGYINDPKKTKEVFLPHPFKKGKRIYKTGDL
ncbi:MAG: non-ribosomal peptide synthetase, partial [Promethearchaeota archaeon]